MTTAKRKAPAGFVADARISSITALRKKYNASQETIYRWIAEAGIENRFVVPKARRKSIYAADRFGKFACGHPRTPDNIVGKVRECCRMCQHAYKARQRIMYRVGHAQCGHLSATPDYNQSVFESAMRQASQDLLMAIWASHPDIMKFAAAKGRLVIQPDGLAA